ncbi:alpha/beta hydrolase family protein [Desulfococcus sp.]|uniref:alpha/beta hydrolase family protein n=1 Tax=Desulfococcus sp. TaxID=2025834 RepID=UPI00359340C5
MRVEAFRVVSNGFEIDGRVHLPAHCPAAGVICSHGLFSSKDSPKFIAMARHLAEQGLVAIRYDHRGCGDSQGRFADTTLSSRLDDLQAVYAFVSRQSAWVEGHMGFMGSSMGGLVSLWAMATGCNIRAAVAWATPWQISKPSKNSAAGLKVLGEAFFKDLRQYRLDRILGDLRGCMIVHGRDDKLVPVTHAYRIYQRLATPRCLRILHGADHRFSNPLHRKRAIRYTTAFLRQNLMDV